MESIMNAPYINFRYFKATPAFILCVIYIGLLTFVCVKAKRNGKLDLKFFKWKDYSEGRKKHIIRTIGGFLVVSIVCWIMPPFFDGDNLLITIVGEYLKYEPIIALGIFLFFCSALLTAKNKDSHVAVANSVLQFVIPISIGSGLYERQIDLNYWPNWIAVFSVGGFYLLLLFVDSKIINCEKCVIDYKYDISYDPVKEIEQLFPRHKAQAERLANLIINSSPEPLSICFSGEWGKGKTSVINGVEQLFKDKDNYSFIRINAMELDDKKSLLNYFVAEIKTCLKEKGIYVGIASEYKEFLLSTVQTLTTESLKIFFRREFLVMKRSIVNKRIR